MWKKQGLLRILNNHLVDYPSPVNVNYLWSIGSIAGICLGIQIISGVFGFVSNYLLWLLHQL